MSLDHNTAVSMELLKILFICGIIQCFQAIPRGKFGVDWTIFPDDDGQVHVVDLKINSSDEISELSENAELLMGETRFWLYTRENKFYYEELFIDQGRRNSSHFKMYKPVVIVTHGWISSGFSLSTQYIKTEYLKAMDLNVIVVDWHKAARTPYWMASFMTAFIGEKIKDMVLTLIREYEFDINDLHLIGFSLGAHVVGRAGNALKQHKAIVPRITGLDPARPLFEYPRVFDAISKNDSHFVDIIHTNSGLFGFKTAIGHADFYPNGGEHQKHCGFGGTKFVNDHRCAYVYYAESINTYMFLSFRCPSYEDFKKLNCDEAQFMGWPCATTARGKYYLDI